MSRDPHLAMTVSTTFEVDTTIRCLVISLLLLIRYVTLTFDLLTLVSGHAWPVTWSTQKDDKSRHFDPHFEEVRGGIEPLVDGSLESPCRVLVKCNWTSFSISYD